MKDGGHLARRGTGEDPRHPPTPPSTPGLEQRSPAAGCINEQAALKGTGSCNADEWSLQSRDEGREQQQERDVGGGGLVEEGSQVGTQGAVVGRGKKRGGVIFTSEFCKLVYHVSSRLVPPQTVSHHLFQRLSRQFVSSLFFFFLSFFPLTPENMIANKQDQPTYNFLDLSDGVTRAKSGSHLLLH